MMTVSFWQEYLQLKNSTVVTNVVRQQGKGSGICVFVVHLAPQLDRFLGSASKPIKEKQRLAKSRYKVTSFIEETLGDQAHLSAFPDTVSLCTQEERERGDPNLHRYINMNQGQVKHI